MASFPPASFVGSVDDTTDNPIIEVVADRVTVEIWEGFGFESRLPSKSALGSCRWDAVSSHRVTIPFF